MLATHQLDGVVRDVPRALEVHGNDGVEVVLGHVPNHALAQHAGRVDNKIDLAECVRALAHHATSAGVVGDRVVVGERLAASFGDFSHDFVGWALRRYFAVPARAWVIYDDAGAFPGHQQCDRPTDAAPGSRDDPRLTFEIHQASPFALGTLVQPLLPVRMGLTLVIAIADGSDAIGLHLRVKPA